MLHAVPSSYHPKETPEEEKWQRKETASLDPQESFGIPTTWLSLSPTGGSTGASTNASQHTPALQCFWASISLCAPCTSGWFDGFADEALSDRVLKFSSF